MQRLQVIPTYISVKLTPKSRLQLAKFYTELAQQGYDPLDPAELHITLLQSNVSASDRDYKMMVKPNEVFTGTIRAPKQLGKFSTLLIESEPLVTRHKEWLRLGLVHSYPDYLPHLSFSKCELTKELEAALLAFEGRTLQFYREAVSIGHHD